MNGENILKKARKNNKWISLLCILIFCLCIGVYFYKEEREQRETPTFKHLSLSQGMGEPGEFASLDVEYMTEEIVVYGNEKLGKNYFDKYHIIISDGNMYIANIDQKLLKDLQPIIDNTYLEEKNATIKTKRIYGVTQTPSEEFKQLAVDAYNKIFPVTEEDKMTLEDYDFTFGKVILNTKVDFVNTRIEETLIICGCLTIIFLIIIKSILNTNTKFSNKYLKKNKYEEELIRELTDEKKLKIYKNEKIFVTPNYLVDIQAGLMVIRFSDVKWVYETPLKSFGIKTGTSVTFHFKNGKTKIQTLEYTNKEKEEFERLIKLIEKRVDNDCIKGFSKKEKEEYKNYKKTL